MTRRTFLRVLGSAVVVASVPTLPLLEPAAAVEAVSPHTYEVVSRPLTYEMLEAAYKSCVVGQERPTMGVCSASTARALGIVYDVEIEDAA